MFYVWLANYINLSYCTVYTYRIKSKHVELGIRTLIRTGRKARLYLPELCVLLCNAVVQPDRQSIDYFVTRARIQFPSVPCSTNA